VRFTVLTATFNRAATIGAVYESLCAQTFRDFEWLIIDDGGVDETGKLVTVWQALTDFPIVYKWKPNGGKHTAVNAGVALARGEFIVILDSDDRCVPTALERFNYHWKQIPEPHKFSNLSCLCMTEDGQSIGELPSPCLDLMTFNEQIRFRYGIRGEGWGINRTDVLKLFPYPEGETFVPEGLVWNRISMHYASRLVNERLRIYKQSSDSLSSKITALRISSPQATLTYYKELALSSAPISLRIRSVINFFRFLILSSLEKRTKHR
jgi:glycosyltransferase involved in cell wall biosynthesis